VARIRPKVFAVVGAIAVVAGAVCAMAFAVAQTSCQGWSGPTTVNVQTANLCTGDAWGARVGWIVVVIGAVMIVLAAVAATPRYSDVRDQRDELRRKMAGRGAGDHR